MIEEEPKIWKVEWEGDPIPLYDFYEDGDEVRLLEDQKILHNKKERPVRIAFDADDLTAKIQFTDTEELETYEMNMAYMRQEARDIYDLYFKARLNKI